MTKQRGYSLPLSPGGTASLVPAPPWHYVGDFLVIEYWAEPAAVAAVLPEGIEPFARIPAGARRSSSTGSPARRGAMSWSTRRGGSTRSSSSSSPVRSTARRLRRCPYIWVDRDFALVRGWIQGFPKKLGQIEMTRSFGLDCLGRRGGRSPACARPTGVCSRGGRSRPSASLRRGPTHNDPPLVNRRHFPRLASGRQDDPAVHELVRARSSDRSISAIHEGPATLELHDAPGEEHAALAPVRVGKGFRFTFAYTVDDLETVREV